MNRLFHLMQVLASVMAIVCGALVFWAMFVEKPFLRYEGLPFATSVNQVRPGEVVPVIVRRCNDASITKAYVVTRDFVEVTAQGNVIPDGGRYSLRAVSTKIKPGCETVTSRIYETPPDMKPGFYFTEGHSIGDKSIGSFVVPFRSQVFEVRP